MKTTDQTSQPSLPQASSWKKNASLLLLILLFAVFFSSSVNAVTTRNAGTYAELTAAYTASADGDIINITNNIVVPTAQLTISKSLTFNGNGFTISVPEPGLDDMGRFNASASGWRVFEFNTAGKSVIINNLTIKGGNGSTAGGAIWVSSSTAILTLNHCTISNSRTTPFVGGGGIFNQGVLYMNWSYIIRNSAEYGGGLLNSAGIAYLESCTMSENRATSANGSGGAVENNSSGKIYFNNSTLSNNQSYVYGGAISNIQSILYFINSSATGNVVYSAPSSCKGGVVLNLGANARFYAVNSLFAYNYKATGGSDTSPTGYVLDDIIGYTESSDNANINFYNCIYHATLPGSYPIGTSDSNIHFTGNTSGSDNTIFSGGSFSKLTDINGNEIGDAIYRPFLYNNNGSVAPTLKSGSFVLSNLGTCTRFANNNNVNPVVAYYYGSSYLNLTGTSASGQEVLLDQVGAARPDPPARGAIQGTVDNLYMLKILGASTGTVNGGTLYGDVYPSGTSVNVTAIPNSGYSFTRYDYVLGGTGTASTTNPYTFNVTANTTLQPVFTALAGGSYTINYIGNGNTGGTVPAGDTFSASTTIASQGTLVRANYSFTDWNTNSNGSGTAYASSASYSAGANLALYAQWDLIPPTITSFTPSTGPVGTLVTITGSNLSSPTSFTIGGIAAIVVSNDGTSLVGMVMPGATTGTVSVTTAGGTATGSGNFTVTTTPYPGAQQSMLVGTGNTGAAMQGASVAVSADGNTAVVGGYADNSYLGAVWIYTRSGTTWTQQTKLVGTGASASTYIYQGYSVAISADGNTVIEGGYGDNSQQGALWVFTRSGSTWSQQGNKLVGTGGSSGARQSGSVALSADGNTAIVGGNLDGATEGAAWVFTRSAGTWSQQGNKLVGTGAVNPAFQGNSVTLSADGNTAMVGGSSDNSSQGAVWVYTRSAGTWSQQGNKLVGTGVVGAARQGRSVALSADGNTAIVGGHKDDTNMGAVWVYTRSGSSWSQQGSKLVGTGITGASANQGQSVSLSADGNTAIVGGNTDNTSLVTPYPSQGAAWIYTRSGSTWSQQGSKLTGTGNTGTVSQGQSVSLSADGTTAMVGGYNDNSNQGAAWVFVPGSSCANPTSGGTISAAQTICSGFAPAAFTSSAAASGNTGTLEYKWQVSTTSSSGGFSDISPAVTTETYAPGALSASTWYKRLARVSCMADWTGAVGSTVVAVTVNQPSFTPGTFTVANLQATGTGIKWYAASSGGTALATSTALVNGTHYYASQTVNSVESTARLDVTATIDQTPCAPSGTASQSHVTGATVASLLASGTSIRWYAAASGGAALATSTVLVTGTHYYATQTVSCTESATRLDVTVTVVSLAIGDSYGGGKIFYLLQSGDTGYDVNVQHGLIAATSNQGTVAWGCYGTSVPGADGTAIGTGRQNTLDMINAGCLGAAPLVYNVNIGGYTDWYLASKDEMAKLAIYTTIDPEFLSWANYYWTSSESSTTNAWYQHQASQSVYPKNTGAGIDVRAVRSF